MKILQHQSAALRMQFIGLLIRVMAVGSINSSGEISLASAQGDKLEIVAPGDQIMSSGAFDGVAVLSGTSMAAPHVTGVASILWQKDLKCSNEFIRQLINYSANLYGNQSKYGNGLIDLRFAIKQYDKFKKIYEPEIFMGIKN